MTHLQSIETCIASSEIHNQDMCCLCIIHIYIVYNYFVQPLALRGIQVDVQRTNIQLAWSDEAAHFS